MSSSATDKPRRFQLTLRKPRLPWHPKPTVVFNGRGQPAQWGTGTWQLATDGDTTVSVFLFNRLWTYGSATFVQDPDHPVPLTYSAPAVPFLRGRLRITPSQSPTGAR